MTKPITEKDPSLKRHLAKTITWRIVGTIDTTILGWVVSGNPLTGLKIGGLEVVTKMVLYFLHERAWYRARFGREKKKVFEVSQTLHQVVRQDFSINAESRARLKGHEPMVVWFTGLSGSGKSTISNALANLLHSKGIHTMTLDGDNTRLGINKDLDFSDEGRKENIRRVAEIAGLMADSGLVVLSSFISPFEEDREQARSIIGADRFVEVFVDTPLEVCEQRDVKGLYAKARNGEIKNFTGISSPFEAPEHADIRLFTPDLSLTESCEKIIYYLEPKLKLTRELV